MTRLVIIENAGYDKFRKPLVKCRCKCGTIVIVDRYRVLREITKSCGCLQKETAAATSKSSIRKNYGEAAFNCVYGSYRQQAKRRKLEFTLTPDDFKKIVSMPCDYCGDSPRNTYRKACLNGGFVYTGIDRVDNSHGYTAKNVVPCCKTCNIAKHTMGRTDFLNWIRKVHAHTTDSDHQSGNNCL